MDGEFVIPYVPKDQYKEIGYHKTLCINLDNIRKNGFKPSTSNDDWLGFGVYFWDNIENAKWWNIGPRLDMCIIICELKCDSSQYLNLDIELEMAKLDKFSRKYIRYLTDNSLPRPKFKNANQKKKFFCDLYCTQNNFIILSHTFKHDIINHAGFKIGTKKRRQICVRNSKFVQIISVDGGD